MLMDHVIWHNLRLSLWESKSRWHTWWSKHSVELLLLL